MIKQPFLGVISTVLAVGVSFLFIAQFEYHTFHTWVTYLSLAMIPSQILIAAFWKCERPQCISSLNQPVSGIGFLSLSILAGLIVSPLILLVVVGNVTPPTPIVVMFCIHSVVMFIWMAKIFHGWPMNVMSENSIAVGLLMLIFSYVMTYVTFYLFFDFDFLKNAPFYTDVLDPRGLFSAWPALVFSVTAAAVMLMIVMLMEFWPVRILSERYPCMKRQPGQGVVVTFLVLFISVAVFGFCIYLLKMDVVAYMIKVPVSLIFGIFIYQNMMQRSIFKHEPQPQKGALLIPVCASLGLVMHFLYRYCAPYISGVDLKWGGPHYELELWIASAQLAVTFPVMVIFSGFFNFWPLQRNTIESSNVVSTVNEPSV